MNVTDLIEFAEAYSSNVSNFLGDSSQLSFTQQCQWQSVYDYIGELPLQAQSGQFMLCSVI